MAEWLFAVLFTSSIRAPATIYFDCLEHRADIEKWRESLTEG